MVLFGDEPKPLEVPLRSTECRVSPNAPCSCVVLLSLGQHGFIRELLDEMLCGLDVLGELRRNRCTLIESRDLMDYI